MALTSYLVRRLLETISISHEYETFRAFGPPRLSGLPIFRARAFFSGFLVSRAFQYFVPGLFLGPSYILGAGLFRVFVPLGPTSISDPSLLLFPKPRFLKILLFSLIHRRNLVPAVKVWLHVFRFFNDLTWTRRTTRRTGSDRVKAQSS